MSEADQSHLAARTVLPGDVNSTAEQTRPIITRTGPAGANCTRRSGRSAMAAATTCCSGRVARAMATAGVSGASPPSNGPGGQFRERTRRHIDRGRRRRIGETSSVEIGGQCAIFSWLRNQICANPRAYGAAGAGLYCHPGRRTVESRIGCGGKVQEEPDHPFDFRRQAVDAAWLGRAVTDRPSSAAVPRQRRAALARPRAFF